MNPVDYVEHRAHYLQHRDDSLINGRRLTRYYATCDCGWLGPLHNHHYDAAQDYSEHMGRVVPCRSCGK